MCGYRLTTCRFILAWYYIQWVEEGESGIGLSLCVGRLILSLLYPIPLSVTSFLPLLLMVT